MNLVAAKKKCRDRKSCSYIIVPRDYFKLRQLKTYFQLEPNLTLLGLRIVQLTLSLHADFLAFCVVWGRPFNFPHTECLVESELAALDWKGKVQCRTNALPLPYYNYSS